MKVLVASTIVPGNSGGSTIIIDSLERALVDRGHEVDVLRLPFDSTPPVMLEQMLAMRLHHVEHSGDRLICIRTPSYLLQHPAKVLWFIHHHRGAYDLWKTDYADIQDNAHGVALRDAIVAADQVAFSEARAIYANSREVSDRLARYNDVAAEVLYPPLDRPERFRCDGYGDFVLYVSRLADHKRQVLAVQAMAHTRTPVRLVIAGAPDAPHAGRELAELARAIGIDDRVEIRAGWLDEGDKIELFARCLAAVYCPYLEDSYGYPSLEAHHSGKAVVATTDGGGVRELIVDGVNGFLAEPTPVALAACFDRLYEDRAMAERMGAAGTARLGELGISWDNVITKMLR